MRWRVLAGLALAIVAVSWAAPLARLVNAAPLAVAMWRMVLAAGILLPLARFRVGLRLPPGRWPAVVLAGVLMGLHFGLWIPSLWLTSVSASVVLVDTSPLWVLVLSSRALGVRVQPRNLASFALALSGVAIIAGGDVQISTKALLGDVMALVGAVCLAGYLIVGKRLRHEMPLDRYLGVVYSVAGVVLVVVVLVLGIEPGPRDNLAWLPLLGLAVIPTLVGHSMLNWALAHFGAYHVNLAMLGEPVLATGWAWLVLAEAPPAHVVPGGVLVVVALLLELVPRKSRPLVPKAS